MSTYDWLRQEINDAFAALQAVERRTGTNSIQAIVARGYWWGLERAAVILKEQEVETPKGDNIQTQDSKGD